MGIFDSGADFSEWGLAEWAAIGLGSYVAISLFSDIGKGVSGTRKRIRRAGARRRKRAQLKQELKATGGLF